MTSEYKRHGVAVLIIQTLATMPTNRTRTLNSTWVPPPMPQLTPAPGPSSYIPIYTFSTSLPSDTYTYTVAGLPATSLVPTTSTSSTTTTTTSTSSTTTTTASSSSSTPATTSSSSSTPFRSSCPSYPGSEQALSMPYSPANGTLATRRGPRPSTGSATVPRKAAKPESPPATESSPLLPYLPTPTTSNTLRSRSTRPDSP